MDDRRQGPDVVGSSGDVPTGDDPHGADARDRALVRLEDVLSALPFDRAVPDVEDVLRRARVDVDVLHDERARKLLREALLARPFSSLDAVTSVRTEVELLTLEVEVLTEQLADRTSDAAGRGRAVARLGEVERRLAEIRERL